MVKCEKCFFENSEKERYCKKCKAKLYAPKYYPEKNAERKMLKRKLLGYYIVVFIRICVLIISGPIGGMSLLGDLGILLIGSLMVAFASVLVCDPTFTRLGDEFNRYSMFRHPTVKQQMKTRYVPYSTIVGVTYMQIILLALHFMGFKSQG